VSSDDEANNAADQVLYRFLVESLMEYAALQQLRRLRALGCEFGQGSFFAPPLDGDDAARLPATTVNAAA